MMCIGDEKLTKDRIKAGNIFSANLVTEKLFPMADYLGNHPGYDRNKMNFYADISNGSVLDVPILTESPANYELEVARSIPIPVGERLKKIAPISTSCSTYFSHTGETLGAWGEPREIFVKNKELPIK